MISRDLFQLKQQAAGSLSGRACSRERRLFILYRGFKGVETPNAFPKTGNQLSVNGFEPKPARKSDTRGGGRADEGAALKAELSRY